MALEEMKKAISKPIMFVILFSHVYSNTVIYSFLKFTGIQ